MGLFNKITDFIKGKTSKPVQPDMVENIKLLQEAKMMIETGIFIRFFKKPFIGLIELIIYSFSLTLAIGGYWLSSKIDKLINVVVDATNVIEILFHAHWNLGIISFIEFLLFIFLMLPAFFSFLMGRLFTRARQRINVFVDVERIIDKVIYNLSNNSK